MGLAEATDEVEDFGGIAAGGEGAGCRHLVHDAVGEGIGEGDPEFKDIGPGICEGLDDLKRAIHVGVTCTDVGNKGLFPLFLQACEGVVDASAHEEFRGAGLGAAAPEISVGIDRMNRTNMWQVRCAHD